ncbi:acyl-CoA dehydrogenase family protein [Limibacter armeniacum]|uniref:acyl-CoA dehydrogenase family protein n=1 Tax=Limibacter armeniacum TaxID=466084 RepID=UPI002FE67B66
MMIPRNIYTEEHQLFIESVRDFYEKEIVPHHDQWEKEGMISREAWKKAGEMGFLCINMPEEYGGSDVDFRYSAILIEEQAKSGCSGPGFSLHSDIVAPYILHQGTELQKHKYLPKMATGEIIAALGMTEPGAGSDLKNIRTTAIKEGDHYIVNGSKTFITNGYMSDLVLVAVKTDSQNSDKAKGISLLLMDTNAEGFSKNKPFKKVGMKAQDTCELFFDNVKVPASNLIGEEGMGFIYMMQELPRERLIVAVTGIATAEAALQHTIRYVNEREAFGKPVSKFQNTRFKIAEMASEIQMGRLLVDRCIELLAEGKLDAETGAMAKYICTEIQCKVVDECVQLHGGYGYMWEYWIARAYADSRVQKIYAGTNEIMKEIIARKLLDNKD